MLRLHIDPHCDRCRELRHKLTDSHLAFQVQAESDGNGSYMVDNDQGRIEGHNAIEARIEELAGEFARSRQSPGDGHRDPTGPGQ